MVIATSKIIECHSRDFWKQWTSRKVPDIFFSVIIYTVKKSCLSNIHRVIIRETLIFLEQIYLGFILKDHVWKLKQLKRFINSFIINLKKKL